MILGYFVTNLQFIDHKNFFRKLGRGLGLGSVI